MRTARDPRRHARRPTYRAYREHNLALAARAARDASHGAPRAAAARAGPARRAGQADGARAARPAARSGLAVPRADRRWRPNRHYDGEAPQALLVTGVGVVSGREVMIIANDSSLKGGAWYPITTRKIVRALQIALENRLPVVHMLDSRRRATCTCRTRSTPGPGTSSSSSASSAPPGIPQLAVVFGYCTAGGAYTPTLCDQTIMVRGTRRVFLAGPPLVKAATGEEVTAEELGGADMHTMRLGTADYAVDTEARGVRAGPRRRRRLGAPREGRQRPARARGAVLRPRRALRDHPRRHQEAVRDARGDRAGRRRQPLPRVQAALRRHDGHRLGLHLGDEGRDPRQQRRDLFSEAANKATHVHAALRPRRRSRCCSCTTSPASWSAASTSAAGSPRTARRC